jgi:hypothetical protein
MAALGYVSGSGIEASKASDSGKLLTTGRTSPFNPDRSSFNTLERVGGLLRSGPLQRMKGSGSFATLLERRALIRIKMVDGSLAAVIVPASECPTR